MIWPNIQQPVLFDNLSINAFEHLSNNGNFTKKLLKRLLRIRSLFVRGAARIRTGDGGFAIRCLSPLGHGANLIVSPLSCDGVESRMLLIR